MALQRLRTDYVDVVHLHSCTKKVLQQSEVIEALQKAKHRRFTLKVPGVCTAIVGIKNPQRYEENARIIQGEPMSDEQFNAIRSRFQEVADATWVDQV